MTKGQCLCGAIQFETSADAIWALACHCKSCQRATASPVTAFVCFPREAVSWSGETPEVFHSSARAERWFCGTCGSQLAYLSKLRIDEIDLYTALLDDPEAHPPTGAAFSDEALSFTRHIPDLPKATG